MFGTTHQSSADAVPVVLVVDDLEILRMVIRAGLRRQGFEVRLSGDGREAIDLFRRDPEAIDLVLLDVQMPGLDGPEVLTALQIIDPDVRAFLMTGDPGRYGEESLLAAGALRVFPKPLDITAVAAEFRRNLQPANRAVRCGSP